MSIWVFCGLLAFACIVSFLLLGHYEKHGSIIPYHFPFRFFQYEKQKKHTLRLEIITFVLLLTTTLTIIFGISVYNKKDGWKEVSTEEIFLDTAKANEIVYEGEDGQMHTLKDSVTLSFLITKMEKITYEKRILFLVWTKTEVSGPIKLH